MMADMHRARHLAWELPKLGWEVEILSPDSSYQSMACLEDDSSPFFLPEGRTTWAPSFLPGLFRWLGTSTIGWRALVPMFFAGCHILRERRADIVYFSTTQFSLFLLGPLWRLIFQIPYALDFHDPCVKEDNSLPVWLNTAWRYAVTRFLFKRIERTAVRWASAVIAVSPEYIELLRRRYGSLRPLWVKHEISAVIPFAAHEHDFTEVTTNSGHRRELDPRTRIVYVGAGGPIMVRAFTLLCQGLAELRVSNIALTTNIQVDLYGTVYGWEHKGGERKLQQVAEKYELDDIVQEHPERVSYRRSLELLLSANGALILGVDDRGYMPSKLFSYALSGKPLLAVLHRDGPAYQILHGNRDLGQAVWFEPDRGMPSTETAKIIERFLHQCRSRRRFDRRASIQPFLAPTMAARHAKLFEECLDTR
jgi:hypothetical protein